jgi:hypothetical protein
MGINGVIGVVLIIAGITSIIIKKLEKRRKNDTD